MAAPVLAVALDQSSAGPLLMGVTVLVSEAGPADEIRDKVAGRARQARGRGLDGVIRPGREAAARSALEEMERALRQS